MNRPQFFIHFVHFVYFVHPVHFGPATYRLKK